MPQWKPCLMRLLWLLKESWSAVYGIRSNKMAPGTPVRQQKGIEARTVADSPFFMEVLTGYPTGIYWNNSSKLKSLPQPPNSAFPPSGKATVSPCTLSPPLLGHLLLWQPCFHFFMHSLAMFLCPPQVLIKSHVCMRWVFMYVVAYMQNSSIREIEAGE